MGEDGDYTLHCTVIARITPALRRAAMRAIAISYETRKRKSEVNVHRSQEVVGENGGPKRITPSAYQTNALPLGHIG